MPAGAPYAKKIRVPLKVKRELELMIGLEPTTYALPKAQNTFYSFSQFLIIADI